MTYLADSSVWLERLLEQEQAEEVGDFLDRVKRAAQGVDPSAEVWLYGSQARGEAGATSDWDFLVLLDGPVTRATERRIRRALYEIELDTERIVSSIIHSRAKWSGEEARWSPFRQNVHRDAVVL